MKQRIRIRRLKNHLYPWWIYAARRRKAWAEVGRIAQGFGAALRKAYEEARA
jgi:hypothetical protein